MLYSTILYSTSISSEMHTSPSPSYTTPFAFGLYGVLLLLVVSLILNIILIITLCCKKCSVKRKDSTPRSSPPAPNPDTDDYIPMGSNSVCFELRSNEPIYNVIDHRTIEPIYNLPSNNDKPLDSHLTTDTEYHLVTEEKSTTMTSEGHPDPVLPVRPRESQLYVKMNTQEKGDPSTDDASHFYH
ncbi:PREDICTED: uncharacterized protein LOC109586519 [Amphimedon queenslandica]|nr:PREDICTED: uncharacterized protein LOC109586519 [Amphimedon queenslandica]|eukprot:XP_019858278.1 PREDICTED: uncharacterized protein LOC109586519 [Amphimedon queenslandica]